MVEAIWENDNGIRKLDKQTNNKTVTEGRGRESVIESVNTEASSRNIEGGVKAETMLLRRRVKNTSNDEILKMSNYLFLYFSVSHSLLIVLNQWEVFALSATNLNK